MADEEKEVVAPEESTELDDVIMNNLKELVTGERPVKPAEIVDEEDEDPADEEDEDPTDEEDEDPTDEEDEDPTDEEDEDPADEEDEPSLKGLEPKQKARIEKRMKQLTALRKTAEEQLEARDAELEALEDRLEAVEQGSVKTDLDLLFLNATSEKELNAAVQDLESRIEWCEDHVDEGFEPEEGEFVEPKAIKRKLRELQKFERRMVPKAQQLLKDRVAQLEEAKQAFPDLFDRNTADGQRYRALMLKHPELKAVAGLPKLLGAAFAFERGAVKQLPKKAPKKAPASPTKKAPKRSDVLDPQKHKKKAVNFKRVVDQGGDRDSVAAALEEMGVV